MTRIGISGANGFIGSLLVKRLCEEGCEVISFVKPNDTANLDLVREFSKEVYYVDLLDPGSFPKTDLDVLIHLAWIGVNGADKALPESQKRNLVVADNVAIYAKQCGVRRFLALGTISECAYDYLRANGRSTEDEALSPSLLYAKYKRLAYLHLRATLQEQGILFTWLRMSNLYGETNKTGNILSYAISQLLDGHSPVFGPCDQYYDFLYVNDAITAIARFVLSHKSTGDQYFIGSSHPRLLKDYILCLAQKMGAEDRVVIGGRPGDGMVFKEEWFDNSRTTEAVGCFESGTFEENISKVISALKP